MTQETEALIASDEDLTKLFAGKPTQYRKSKSLPKFTGEAGKKDLQEIEDILFRFYGIRYYYALGYYGWYHAVDESLIPRDKQPELIRNFPCSICFPTKEDND